MDSSEGKSGNVQRKRKANRFACSTDNSDEIPFEDCLRTSDKMTEPSVISLTCVSRNCQRRNFLVV